MCRFGTTSHVREKDGPRGLVKKPTGFITSSRCVAAQLNLQCDGSHVHVHLVGGRAAAAQVDPDELCRACSDALSGRNRKITVLIVLQSHLCRVIIPEVSFVL